MDIAQRGLDFNATSKADPEFIDHLVASVGGNRTNGWSITTEDGWSLWIGEDSPVVPKRGMHARYWGRGIGHPVRGVALGGTLVRYETEDQRRANLQRYLDERDAQDRQRFDDERDSLEQRINALPDALRERIARFRARPDDKPEYKWLPYELPICEDVARVCAALSTPEAIAAWKELPWEQQIAAVPDLYDGHSGCSFGMMVQMAVAYATDPASVVPEHTA